jgi:phosphoribosylglycinamide formyltransferase-1
MKQIAIFASGTGTNTKKIIGYFHNHPAIRISLIASDKPAAGVLNIAWENSIPSLILEKEKFSQGNAYVDELRERKIDFIVLAGFLKKVPGALVKAFRGQILNIHPALLPKYGGKGMYGLHVHEAVIAGGEKETGITIHLVDELYDHGQVVFQAGCEVDPSDTPETLAAKVHLLEYEYFSKIIEEVVLSEAISPRPLNK